MQVLNMLSQVHVQHEHRDHGIQAPQAACIAAVVEVCNKLAHLRVAGVQQ